jgi:alpha-tubulin suppressor-like RCC1 family protein
MRALLVAILIGCGARSGIPDLEAAGGVAPPGGSSPLDRSTRVALSAGFQHACALDGGRVRCWGSNTAGQLGDGTTDTRTTPVLVDGIDDAVEVAVGGNVSCARKSSGAVWCWGDNRFGQLGVGAPASSPRPREVRGVNARSLVVGATRTCAIAKDGSVTCWGPLTDRVVVFANAACADTATCDATPRRVPGLSNVVQISIGWRSTCALTDDGSVWCWGHNERGQLGDGTRIDRDTPARINDLRAKAIALGRYHACALTGDGVRCWGDGTLGRAGSPSEEPESCVVIGSDGDPAQAVLTPRTVGKTADAIQLSAGTSHTCVHRDNGEVACWGRQVNGELDGGSTPGPYTPGWCSPTPLPVRDAMRATSIAIGASFSCAFGSDLRRCWGRNQFGQLGDGTLIDRVVPVDVKW